MIHNTKHQQRGMSLLSWAIILSMVGVFVITGLKLFPVYMDFYKIKDVISSVAADENLSKTAKKEIEKSFLKRLRTNNVKMDKSEYKILKVKGRKSYAIQVDYTVETPLFSNLSLVAHFNHAKEIGAASQ